MKWELIQSASIAAVRAVLEDQNFDVVWENTWEAGIPRADSYVAISLIEDQIIGVPHKRFYTSGSGIDAIIIEKEWQDRRLTLQYRVETLSQQLHSSSFFLASKIRGGFLLDPIQNLFGSVGLAPITPGPIFNNDAPSDRDRVRSISTFEVPFNGTELVQIVSHSIVPILAVEASGAITSSAGNVIYPFSLFITSAYDQNNTVIMDEGLIHFNNESYKSTNFNFIFDQTPHAVVLTINSGVNNSDGIYFHGILYNTESFSMETSAPFSGSLRYRAIWSNLVPDYPGVTTSSLYPSSGVFSASALSMNANALTGDPRVNLNAAYYALSDIPNEFWISHWSLGNPTTIPVISFDDVDEDSAKVELAAPLHDGSGTGFGKFDFIAFLTSSI